CLKESTKNIVGDFVVKNDATVSKRIAPCLVVSEPIRAAQSLTVRVAKLRDKRAYFAGNFVRLHHLIEIGIDPTVLPPNEKNNHTGCGIGKQSAQTLGMIRPQILRRKNDRFKVRSPTR